MGRWNGMAKGYAKGFYNSVAWQYARDLYLKSQDYICEMCGAPALIVHHKIYITPKNINDPSITLDFNNFQAVCSSCHQHIHFDGDVTREDCRFNEQGELIEVHRIDW